MKTNLNLRHTPYNSLKCSQWTLIASGWNTLPPWFDATHSSEPLIASISFFITSRLSANFITSLGWNSIALSQSSNLTLVSQSSMSVLSMSIFIADLFDRNASSSLHCKTKSTRWFSSKRSSLHFSAFAIKLPCASICLTNEHLLRDVSNGVRSEMRFSLMSTVAMLGVFSKNTSVRTHASSEIWLCEMMRVAREGSHKFANVETSSIELWDKFKWSRSSCVNKTVAKLFKCSFFVIIPN